MLEGPRALRRHEFDALMDLIDDTFRGPDWPRPTKPKLYSLLLNPETNLEGMRVFVHDGQPVSHFGFYVREVFCGGITLKLAGVGSVCTHPEFRGRGLATRLLEDALHLCEQQGVHVMLISGGRGLYRRQGACDVGEMLTYTFSGEHVQGTGEVRLEPWTDETLPLFAAMHQREPFRYYRSLDDWKRVVRGGSDMNRDAETFLIYENDTPRAYASIYAPEDGESGFVEYAGSRHALMASIPKLFDRYDLRRFLLSVPAYDLEWHSLCEGLPAQPGTIHGHTARLISLTKLISALEPYVVERLGKDGGNIRWGDGLPYRIISVDGSLEIEDIATLTQLVLGPHTAEIQQRLGEAAGLGEQLRQIFPIPFNFPGLNFV